MQARLHAGRQPPLPQRAAVPPGHSRIQQQLDAAARSSVNGSGGGVTGSPPARPGRHADRPGSLEGRAPPQRLPCQLLLETPRSNPLPGAPERPSGSATGVGGAAHAERGGPAAAAGFGALPDIGSSSWVQPQQSLGYPAPYPSAATPSQPGAKQPAHGQVSGQAAWAGTVPEQTGSAHSLLASPPGARALPPEPVLAPVQRRGQQRRQQHQPGRADLRACAQRTCAA